MMPASQDCCSSHSGMSTTLNTEETSVAEGRKFNNVTRTSACYIKM